VNPTIELRYAPRTSLTPSSFEALLKLKLCRDLDVVVLVSCDQSNKTS
jgi:hypothetical protein